MNPFGWILCSIVFGALVSALFTREPRKRRDLGTLSPRWRGTSTLEDELHRTRQERE